MFAASLQLSIRFSASAAAFTLLATVPASAQRQTSARIAQCESLLVSQQSARESRKRPFLLHLLAGNGAQLTYFGVRHTYDPADTQFVSLQREFGALKPTILFYEGTGGATRTPETADDAVRADGEPGLARFHARGAGVPSRSLEPARADEVAALLKRFSADELAMFYALRPMMELRTRVGLTGTRLDSSLVRQLVAVHRIPGLQSVFADTAALRSTFARRFLGIDMMALPPDWFDPALVSEDVPKRLFNAINYESSMFRDLSMYRLLATTALDSTTRIFAEVGRDHIPAQAAALRCALDVAQ